jgi:hypothetical protein
VFAAGGIWLFSSSVIGGKVLSPGDAVQAAAPFAAHRAPSLRVSNFALDDLSYLFEPHLYVARQAVRDGRLPLWNSSVGTGRPLGGEQGGPLFPTSWLAYILPFWSSLAFIALAKVLLAAGGTYLLARALALRRSASLLSAVAFGFSTLFIVFVGHGQTNALALAPWMLWAAERLVVRARVFDAILLAVLSGLALFSGHPETTLLDYLIVAAFLGFRLVVARRARRMRRTDVRRRLLLAAGAGALAAFIGALMIVPFLQLLHQSFEHSRATGGKDSARDLALGLFFPELFGRPDKIELNHPNLGVLTSVFAGRTYIGALPVLLAAGGLAVRRSTVQWFFVAAAVVSGLIMVVHPIRTVVGKLPLLSLVNLHEFIWPLTLSLALLAGFGVQRLLEASAEQRRRAWTVMAAVAILPIAAWLGTHPHLLGSLSAALQDLPTMRRNEHSADAAALGAILRWAILCGIGALVLRVLGARGRALALTIVAITVADLVTIDRGFQPAVPEAQAHPRATPSMVIAAKDPSARVIGIGIALGPDLAETYGLRDGRVEDLPPLTRYTRLFTALGGAYNIGLGLTEIPAGRPPDRRLLDLLGAKYVIDDATAPPARGLTTVYSRPGERLRENPHAFPHAWVAYGWRGSDALNTSLTRIIDSSAHQLLNEPVLEGARSRSSGAVATPAHVTGESSSHVTIEVDATTDGFLVLDDAYYPGWSAKVNGRAAPIRAANAAFRAVAVPGGHDVVTFEYSAGAVRFSAWVTLGAIILSLLGLFFASARWKRRSVDARSGVVSRPPGSVPPRAPDDDVLVGRG